MPSKRAVLAELKRDELLAALDLFELEVADRRVRAQLIDALAGSRRAKIAEALGALPRTRLKEICRALGLDDSGREKALLIARLTGAPGSSPAPSVKSVEPRSPQPAAPARAATAGSRAKLPASRATRDLKSHLWNCAEILRGSAVDRTDWKAYILPLLFFKRISDVWDEETADAANLYGDVAPVDFPEVHRFHVPEGCHWSDVRATPANVGTALSRAMREIERANPDTLYRVFGAADWGNREILTDEVLKNLIEGLSEVPLGNTAVASDVLGDAYEYLIGKFADVTKRKKAGEFYTPRSIVRMMIELLNPKAGESIYDPACGTGGMLLAAIEHVQRAGGDPRTFFGKIYGQEKNLTTAAIARMNLVLHGIEDFQVVREDTLRSPAFTDSSTGGLATFDCVVANPPFSLKEWGCEVWESDPWGRAVYGLPPDSYGDYAWVQHMVASMAVGTGRMAVVLPQGALFRKGAEGRIRLALLRDDLIEAVIGLAPNIFYGTGLAPAVVILRRTKPAGLQGKVLIVDASSLFRKGLAQNYLDPEHARQIVDWVRNFTDVENRVKVISFDQINAEDWALNISRYVLPPLGEELPPLAEALASFKLAVAECRVAEDHLREVLTEGGWLA